MTHSLRSYKKKSQNQAETSTYASVCLSHFLLLVVILSLIVRLVGLNCLKERLSQSLDWMDYVSGCVCVCV